jgi:hypothetical protein
VRSAARGTRMADILETFDQLIAANLSGKFLRSIRDGAFANTSVQRHPLGFRVARLMSEGNSSLRLHIWPRSSRTTQPGYEIHDHTFSFRSHVLFGTLEQSIYDVTGSDHPQFSLYNVEYDELGSILLKSRDGVTASLCRRSVLQSGETYQLGAGVFHRLDLIPDDPAATLLLTTQVGGTPKSLGPLKGPDRIRFDRSSYSGTVADDLINNFGAP